jgi:protein-tyrosine-phosphatase
MPRVLIVCTGNICRSPAAEVLLRARLEAEGLTDWEVSSAGTWTMTGRPASREIIQLMAERGLDVAAHRSREVGREAMQQADLVLVMTRNHAEALRLEFPDQAKKIHQLSEVGGQVAYDIQDPYGRPMEVYRSVVAEIARLIDEGWDIIKNLAEEEAY